jgi:hypothetical protein
MFHKGTYNEITYKKTEPCIIFSKIFDNAYKLDILDDMDISPIFNIADIYEYLEVDENKKEEVVDLQEQIIVNKKEEVKEVLVKIIGHKIRKREYTYYLVKWKDKDLEDASWIPDEELGHLVGPSSFGKFGNHTS